MTDLMTVLTRLRPGVDFADTNGTLAGIRWDSPGTPPTQEEVDAALLAIEQEKRCAEVDELYLQKLLAGFLYEGKRFEIDDSSQGKISGLAVAAGFFLLGVGAVTWAPVPFVAADNKVKLFPSAEEFMPFANAAKVAVQALFAHRYALKAACRAARSAKELAAIDISAGWPEV